MELSFDYPSYTPKEKSERNLFTIIKYITLSGEVIPDHYKEEIINILKKMASKVCIMMNTYH